jgi:hypothetical protein
MNLALRAGMTTSRWYRLLASVLLASTLAGASACTVRASTRPVYVVDQPPPEPRAARVSHRPGMVYIQGRWEMRDGKWIWRDGMWRRERPNYVWVQGRWVSHGGRWQWHPGHWESDRAVIRDHRR